MTHMDNNQIKKDVDTLVRSYLLGVKMKPEDKPVLEAGVRLVTNVLCNINDIAYAAIENMHRRET